MEKTIVIDGVEYILTPKNTGVTDAQPTIDATSILDDYIFSEETPTVVEEVIDASPVMIVENTNGIQTAIPRESAYRKRFENRQVRIEDITIRNNFKMKDLLNFKELPEIAQADTGSDRIPSGLGGFYGRGIERDIY